MSWVKDAQGTVGHQCDRCGVPPTTENPFGEWAVVLIPRENAKHFCVKCLEALRVALDAGLSQ